MQGRTKEFKNVSVYWKKFLQANFKPFMHFLAQLSFSIACGICTKLWINYRAAENNWTFLAIHGNCWNLAFNCVFSLLKSLFRFFFYFITQLSYVKEFWKCWRVFRNLCLLHEFSFLFIDYIRQRGFFVKFENFSYYFLKF